MATYLELSNLATDADFLARIGYAIGKYAAYIQNENPGTTAHAARRNWQLKAQSNVQQMAALLSPEICRDANVVYGLGNVTDADLQTATETAANGLITRPVSYTDLIGLATDQGFLRRMQIAVGKFALYILNEDPSTANHPARYAWARNAVLNTQAVGFALAPVVVMDNTVAVNLSGSTDAQLQAAVEVEALALLL